MRIYENFIHWHIEIESQWSDGEDDIYETFETFDSQPSQNEANLSAEQRERLTELVRARMAQPQYRPARVTCRDEGLARNLRIVPLDIDAVPTCDKPPGGGWETVWRGEYHRVSIDDSHLVWTHGVDTSGGTDQISLSDFLKGELHFDLAEGFGRAKLIEMIGCAKKLEVMRSGKKV